MPPRVCSLLSACLLAIGCAPAIENAPTMPPEPPPLTAQDSVVALALRSALSGHVTGRVMLQESPALSAHALPVMDSVVFVVLDSARILPYAQHGGYAKYFIVRRAEVSGDKALVVISTKIALSPGDLSHGQVISDLCFNVRYDYRRENGTWRELTNSCLGP